MYLLNGGIRFNMTKDEKDSAEDDFHRLVCPPTKRWKSMIIPSNMIKDANQHFPPFSMSTY